MSLCFDIENATMSVSAYNHSPQSDKPKPGLHPMLKIGFAGASKTGTVLACYFKAKGLPVDGFYSINQESLAETVKLVGCKSYSAINDLVRACDIIFITPKDDKIVSLWEQIDKTIINNKLICHCSGLLNSDILKCNHAFSASMHPLASISTKHTDITMLNKITFAIEGDDTALTIIQQMLQATNNPYIVLDQQKKTQYHIACVIMTSFYISLYSVAKSMFDGAVIDGSAANANILTAFTSNIIQKIQDGQVLPDIITGPLKRNDLSTIEQHIQALAGDDKLLYQLLSKQLLNILTPELATYNKILNSLQIKEPLCLN